VELYWINDFVARGERPRGRARASGELDAAQSLGWSSRIAIEDQGTHRHHCRQGLGRSPLIAAAMLVRDGMTPTEACDAIAIARRLMPETDE